MATCHRIALANDGKGWQRKNMAWARLDDGFGDHPKTLDVIETLDEIVGAAAIGLWTLGLAYAHRTMRTAKIPGFVPRSFARTARVPASLGDKLCDAGLWERTDGGWLIHDFDQYLPSEHLRAKRAEAGRRGAEARWARESAGQNSAEAKTAGSDSNLPSNANGKNGNACPEPEPEPEPIKKKTPSSSPAAPDRFDELWQIYPRRVGKDKARTAFAAAVKRGADPNAILGAARSYAERCRLMQQDPKYIPHPTTWLNRGSWDDDLDDAVPLPAAPAPTMQPPAYGQPAARPAASCRWCDNGLYERTDGRMDRCHHTDQPPAGHPAVQTAGSLL